MGITIVDLKTGKKKTGNKNKKVQNPSTSDAYKKHKRKGEDSKLHSSRGRIATATIKKNLDAAARRANKRSEKAMRPDNNIITQLGGYITPVNPKPPVPRAKKTSPVPKPKRKPPVPKIPLITGPMAKEARRPTMEEQLKDSGVAIDYGQLDKMAGGGKINYRMSGGQVVANCYD